MDTAWNAEKIEFKRRCQEYGCWDYAVQVREDHKRQHREGDGLEVTYEVTLAAWRLAMEKAGEKMDAIDADRAKAAENGESDPHEYAPSPPADWAVPKSVFKGRTCSEKKAIEWVVENMSYSDVSVDAAPSPKAWFILNWARASMNNQTRLIETIYARMIPTKKEVDEGERRADDGRDVLATLDRIANA